MDEKERLRQIRHGYSVQGWTLLIYYGIMNVAVFAVTILSTIVHSVQMALAGKNLDMTTLLEQVMADSGWGYLLSIAVGVLILLLWKKPAFFPQVLMAKGRPMGAGRFMAILSVFMSGQLIFQIVTMVLDWLLSGVGISLQASMPEISTDALSMFLYVGFAAPIAEELLFRGVLLRGLLPYGKKSAIIVTSLLFGLFHGNLMQAPYAFVVGLVFGYVAVEYNILWAMVLHMFNNLIISDVLVRLGRFLPGAWGDVLIWAIIICFSMAALVILIVKMPKIIAYLRRERGDPLCVKAFFTAPGMVTVVTLLTMIILSSLLLTMI